MKVETIFRIFILSVREKKDLAKMVCNNVFSATMIEGLRLITPVLGAQVTSDFRRLPKTSQVNSLLATIVFLF